MSWLMCDSHEQVRQRYLGNELRARLPIDGRQATGDGADRQGRLNGRRAVGKIDGCVFT